MRAGRKRFWFWMVLAVVLGALLWSMPPVRVQYHKSRLEAVKQKRDRMMSGNLSVLEKFWLQVTGTPASGSELKRTIQRHEDALVRLNFLRRENISAKMISECKETAKTLSALENECPWYHAESVATNLMITACPKMMEEWRKRAKELGW